MRESHATDFAATGASVSVRVIALVWDAPFPTPTAKLVALKLADVANDDGANVFPSRRTIERDTGCGETAVKRWLRCFDAAGLTTVDGPSAGGAYNNTTVRRFDMEALRGLGDGSRSWVAVGDDWRLTATTGGRDAPRSSDAPVASGHARGARRGARRAPKPLNRQDPLARERAGQSAAGASPAKQPANENVRIHASDPRFLAVLGVLARTSPPFAEACRARGYADVRPDQLRRATA